MAKAKRGRKKQTITRLEELRDVREEVQEALMREQGFICCYCEGRVAQAIPAGFQGSQVKRSPLRMIVAKDGEELSVDQLSDGETCTLAMAGDLARRMAVANPSMENPLNSEAVVLIDELDLHLHPAWQRRITTSLRETFPRCQFLLSTHSPQILSHLEPECIWMLERIAI